MTGMEHAIEQAAWTIYGAMHRDTDPYSVPLERAAEKAARALAADGLLAPAPLHVEQGFLDDEGKVWDWSDSLSGDRPVRRWATDWLPVDRAEGDGRAEQ